MSINLIKNNKGGTGKSFTTLQLAHGISLYTEKKVLIITSDSQNQIFTYSFKGNTDFQNGLKSEIFKREGDFFKIRENLDFLPLEDNHFGNKFYKEFPIWIKEIQSKYEYIFIDSVPTLKTDHMFLECSDNIIFVTEAIESSIEGMLNVFDEINIEEQEVHIIINKFNNSKVQKKYLELLEDNDLGEKTFNVIPLRNFIEEIMDNKKTIWEYNNKNIIPIQDCFLNIISKLK